MEKDLNFDLFWYAVVKVLPEPEKTPLPDDNFLEYLRKVYDGTPDIQAKIELLVDLYQIDFSLNKQLSLF
jgi:hypothetical protein